MQESKLQNQQQYSIQQYKFFNLVVAIILCSDFRKVSGISKTDSYPISLVDSCIDKSDV